MFHILLQGKTFAMSICLSLPACLSVCLSVCLSFCPSVSLCLSVYLSACKSLLIFQSFLTLFFFCKLLCPDHATDNVEMQMYEC